jgi:hypothetical protein
MVSAERSSTRSRPAIWLDLPLPFPERRLLLLLGDLTVILCAGAGAFWLHSLFS